MAGDEKVDALTLQLIERYVQDVGTAVWNLDRVHSRLVQSLDSNDKTTVRELLAEQMRDDNSLLNRAKPLLEHGIPDFSVSHCLCTNMIF